MSKIMQFNNQSSLSAVPSVQVFPNSISHHRQKSFPFRNTKVILLAETQI